MNAINWLLIHGGYAVAWLWGGIKTLCMLAWGGLDHLLNPVLSPVLAAVNPIATALGDGVYWLLSPFPAWLGLTALSALAGAAMLLAFKYTSNQRAIGRARDAITANLLALKLFKDDLRATFRAQARLLRALLLLQAWMLFPLLIMILPLTIALAQMGVRYQWRPLRPGEQTLVKMSLAPSSSGETNARLEPGPGIGECVGPVPGGNILVWRVRAAEPGRHTLRFQIGTTTVEKQLVIGDGLQRVSALRPGRRWTEQLLHPVETPLPAAGPVQSVEILYGGEDSRVTGANWWILYFFVVSMLSALILKPIFRVRL